MLDKLGASQDKSEDENRKERTEEYLSREKEIRNWESINHNEYVSGFDE